MAADGRWFALGLFSFFSSAFFLGFFGFFLTRMFGFLGLLGFSAWLFLVSCYGQPVDNFLGLDYDFRQELLL